MMRWILSLPFKAFRWLKHRFQEPGYMVLRMLQSWRHGRALKPVLDRTGAIKPGDILLFCTLRNEGPRMPWFLSYYRERGVDHFIFVDNDSTDSFQDWARQHDDISVWYTDASYRDANFGMHWLNALLRRHGSGHWCVTCDPDEMLVFPYQDTRDLHELAHFMESEDRASFCCVMLDMYSDRPLEQTHYRAGDDPFEIAPWFDGTGYVQEEGWLREIKVQGGVRRRVFFHDQPEQAPSIHKTPFVKWRWSYSYFLSMHQLVPTHLNRPHAGNHLSPTGCLMHFKYFASLEDKVSEEMERKQHWADSYEYRRYHDRFTTASSELMAENSIRFRDWRQLVGRGFMNVGQWF